MKTVQVDVRLISTSNRNMKDAVAEKLFREDLYYRLNVVPIHLPPLRERKEDILPLARYFLERLCAENHKPKGQFSQEAEKKLLAYSWPGNIRELANIVERAVVMSQQSAITDELIFIEAPLQESQKTFPTGLTLPELEKQLIIRALEANRNDKNRTAEALGITLTKLRDKLREYQVSSS